MAGAVRRAADGRRWLRRPWSYARCAGAWADARRHGRVHRGAAAQPWRLAGGAPTRFGRWAPARGEDAKVCPKSGASV